ncbi:MAG TPA: rRNA adenine N-6-methyltransferase family protein, partial [Bacillota bacterium]|nr:rRNA adenine N-6-methyltransferase family protein [Bacillota bacterium]
MNKEKAISILNQYDLDAQKRYGQNFLCDEDVIQSIIDVAQIQDNCDVLEIGPGIGALTEK